MSVDISVSITDDVVDIIATPTVNIVNVTNSASINPGLYDLSQFTNTSINPFVRTSGLSAYVPTTRTISTTSPLTGGGDLSANRTLSIPMATTLVDGYLSAADWTIFNGKQNALGFTPVPTTRTLTINGTTQDLSADRTFTISTGITIGTTAITSGTVGRVLFEGTGNVVQESAGITWDNTNAVFSLGTLATKIINFKPADTTSIFGNTSSIKGGVSGRIDFLNGSNLTHIYDGTVVVGPTAGPYIQVGSTSIAFAIGGTERARFAATTGNFLINTTTDAGFKLDVNGTARVSGNTTFGGTIGSGGSSNFVIAAGNASVEVQTTNPNSATGSIITTGAITKTDSGTKSVILVNNAVTSTAANFNTLNGFAFTSTISQTLGTIRGIYIAPTLTASTDFRAIETTNGKVIFGNLPTSPAGLPTGSIWNNLGILSIV